MEREIVLRIKPSSAALEGKMVRAVHHDYTVTETIKQRVGNESYIYLKVRSKDANP